MKLLTNAPTITTTRDAIIIRIPRTWVRQPQRSAFTEVLQLIADGEREYRAGKLRPIRSLADLKG